MNRYEIVNERRSQGIIIAEIQEPERGSREILDLAEIAKGAIARDTDLIAPSSLIAKLRYHFRRLGEKTFTIKLDNETSLILLSRGMSRSHILPLEKASDGYGTRKRKVELLLKHGEIEVATMEEARKVRRYFAHYTKNEAMLPLGVVEDGKKLFVVILPRGSRPLRRTLTRREFKEVIATHSLKGLKPYEKMAKQVIASEEVLVEKYSDAKIVRNLVRQSLRQKDMTCEIFKTKNKGKPWRIYLRERGPVKSTKAPGKHKAAV